MLSLNHERCCHLDKLSLLAGATNTPFLVPVSLRPRSPFSRKKGAKGRGRREVFGFKLQPFAMSRRNFLELFRKHFCMSSRVSPSRAFNAGYDAG
ncbi:hypothetical protein E2C01_041729 [Portunus trituberculatus]|uniref:Uncharacterized protein n=1 Tax=Portunus trituberculatus TaxID=210409 RepID=A0A5B7FSM4_PORTR|nr:hypothetical protein [Portunus trituberculatus]